MQLQNADRRRSNEGYRKLDLDERVLIFLTRLRRKTPFEELGFQYGCGAESARRYFNELIEVFHDHFVSRLVFPRSPEELRKMSRKEVLEQWPDLLALLDATNWEQMKPGNFLENRLSYSAYKHMNVFQVLFGEMIDASLWFYLKFLHLSSRFNREIGAVAIRNLWWHFQRDLGFARWFYAARRSRKFCVLTAITFFFFSSIDFAGNGYLKKVEEDPAAVVLLGDSAYDRSKNKDTLGIGRPVPLAKDGVQQKVKEQG